MPNLPSLTLALTAYNEDSALSDTVAKALRFLPTAAERFELLIVDDGSTDQTASVARSLAEGNPRIRVLTHDRNRGMGAAIRTAISDAKMEWFSTIAADGQVDPNDLLPFVAPAVAGSFVFSTYHTRDDGADRWILTQGIRALFLLLFGIWKVPTGNYFVPTAILRSLPLRSDSFVTNYEVFLGVRRKKVPCVWVTLPCARRSRGASKVRNLRTIARVFRELLRYRFGTNV